MILTETGAIAASALPVQELSTHLRLGHGFADDGSEDPQLERLLREAVATVEQRSGLALIRRGFELKVPEWDRNGHLVLPVGPVNALASVELTGGGITTVLAASEWHLEAGTGRQRVTGPSGGPLPRLGDGMTAHVTFEAGFGSGWSDVPGDLKRAVMLLAAHGYEHRDGGAEGVPGGLLALLDLRRPVRL